MFFGMCNSPAMFQSMMDLIFIEEIEDGVTIVYMDDILIYATTPELLEKYTKKVLQKLWDHDLFLKAKKCEFNKTKMEYLGLVVKEGKNFHRPNQSQRIRRLAYTDLCKRCQILPGLWEFLPEIYPRILNFSGAPECFIKEGHNFSMDRGNSTVI